MVIIRGYGEFLILSNWINNSYFSPIVYSKNAHFCNHQLTLLHGQITNKYIGTNTFDKLFISLTPSDRNSLLASLSKFSPFNAKMRIPSTPIQSLTILKISYSQRLKCQFWRLTGFVVSLHLYIIKYNRKKIGKWQ